jgi:hypothetical protein
VEQLELGKQERSTVTLKGLGTGGYRWTFTVDDPRLVLVERLVVKPRGDEPAGTWNIDEQFVLIGQNAGETVVRFSQTRRFEPAHPPIATREILVRVRAD